jgi:2-phosphoglycerate kinase
MQDVFWLGGSPCAGKSSIAKRLAKDFGFHLYHADEHFEDHCQKAKQRQPHLQKISKLSPDDIWLVSAYAQYERALQIYQEEFAFILTDLAYLPRPTLLEGAALLPTCVSPLLGKSSKAVYLVPDEMFQRTHYAHREWAQVVVAQTSHPAQAFENWMQRDILFALEVKRQAEEVGLPVIIVDSSQPLEKIESRVRHHLKLE